MWNYVEYTGATLYFASKIFLFAAMILLLLKQKERERILLIAGWLVYLVGLVAVVPLLNYDGNWIFASVEAGGAPAMLLGLVIAWRRMKKPPLGLEMAAKWFAGIFLALGVAYSYYRYGGFVSVTQALELGGTAGFLLGTLMLGQKQPLGWVLYAIMNLCTARLMSLEGRDFFMRLQYASAGLAIAALVVMAMQIRKNRLTSGAER